MAFGNTFTDGPEGTDAAANLASYLKNDTKRPLNERYALEHVDLRSAESGASDSANANAQGRHVAGKVGVLGKGDTATRNALTDMGTGALFYDTDDSVLYRYNMATSSWEVSEVGGGQTTVWKDDHALTRWGTSGSYIVSPVEYTNTSSRKLMIVTYGEGSLQVIITCYTGESAADTVVARTYTDPTNSCFTACTFIVPPGWKYKVDCVDDPSPDTGEWARLRSYEAWEI